MNFLLKLKIFVFLLSLFFSTSAISEKISEIEITGNERISKDTILMFSNVKIGDQVDQSDLNEILKKIYDTNFFDDVKITLDRDKIIISVVENPIVEEVIFNGIKAKKIIAAVKQNLNMKNRSSYNELLVNKDVSQILFSLKNLGYYFSTVETKVENLGDNKVNIIYDVVMGEKAKIKSVSAIKDLAIATLCCSPPDKSLGKKFNLFERFTKERIFFDFS